VLSTLVPFCVAVFCAAALIAFYPATKPLSCAAGFGAIDCGNRKRSLVPQRRYALTDPAGSMDFIIQTDKLKRFRDGKTKKLVAGSKDREKN